MKDTFDTSRFGKLFVYELKNYTPAYIKALILINSVPVALWIISVMFGFSVGAASRSSTIISLGSVAVLCAPFLIYKHINDLKKGYSYTIQPASIAEKMLSMYLICILIVPAATFASSLLVDGLLLGISSLGVGHYSGSLFSSGRWLENIWSMILPSSAENGITGDINMPRILWSHVMCLVLNIVLAILFNALFRKSKIAKSILTLIVVGFTGILLLGVMAQYIPDFLGKILDFIIVEFSWLTGLLFFICCTAGTWYRLKNVNY